MNPKTFIFMFVCLFGVVNCSSFAEFQKAMDKAAQDLSGINKASADKFRSSAGLVQEDPPTQAPTTPKSCGGWLQKACPTTTTPPPTPAPAAACGGWLQKACPTTTTPPPTPAPPCGGWFQPACDTAGLSLTVSTTPIPTTTTTPSTTPIPSTTPKAPACGGWFQPACDPNGLSLTVSTTPAPTTTPSTTPIPSTTPKAPACGGWFQSACDPNGLSLSVSTTPTPTTTTQAPACGGWFQSACEDKSALTTPAPVTQSCGWLYCSDVTTTTTTTPKPKGWGLFGNYGDDKQIAETTPAPSGGWLSGIVSGVYGTVDKVKSTTGLAVGTALDVTSKIVTASLNGGVDFLINQIKLVARTTNMDVVSLPDLDIPLYPGAKLVASGGYFKSVTSISRGGDIVISRDGLAFIIDFSVELKNMEIGFKNYEITVLMGMGTSGEIKVGVKQNKINIRIRLAISTSCAINLEKVDFAVLDGLDIQMTYGCSMCGFITDKATTYLANFLQNTIRLQIQGQIDSILKKTLSENSLICSKFMGA